MAHGGLTHCATYLRETAKIAKLLDHEEIEDMVRELVSLRDRSGKLFIVGLGGSAANASHAVNDFRKLCGIEAFAPTDNAAEMTARINDEGWDNWLVEYLRDAICYKDLMLVLSVGGGTDKVSIPISKAVERYAGGIKTWGIVGRKKGITQKYGKVIVVPEADKSRVTPHTESFQSVILHCLVSHPKLQLNSTKW